MEKITFKCVFRPLLECLTRREQRQRIELISHLDVHTVRTVLVKTAAFLSGFIFACY